MSLSKPEVPGARWVLMGNLNDQPDTIKETPAWVQEYAQRDEATAEAILLAWLLKHPAKIQPVLGATSPNPIAGPRQGALGFLKPREMVFTFCRS